MKILIHQPRLSYYLGGGETVPLKQAELLSELGFEIEILTSKPPKYSSVFEDFKKNNPQITIHELELSGEQRNIYDEEPGKDWYRWDKETIFFGQKSMDFYSKLEINYDLVITHLLSDSLFVPERFRNVLHLHGVPSEKRAIDKVFLVRPNNFVSVSKSVKDGWESLYPELKRRSIDICYNGIDANKFRDENLKRDIDFLYVGRLLPHKGIYEIISALYILKTKELNFNKLVMVGSGPEKENLIEKIRELSLENDIELKDGLSNEELFNLYNRSKIFLCPSYAKEGVLTTMLEAASCGACVITADACGMPEFANDERNAVLAKPQNINSLAELMERLLKDNTLREKLRNQAKLDIQERWNTTRTIEELAKLYKSYAR